VSLRTVREDKPIRMVREGMSVGGLVKTFSLSRRYVRACLSETLRRLIRTVREGMSVGNPEAAYQDGT
jgi:actin-like ATPase involved in cell morphogenesis